MASENSELIALTAEIVAAHVSNNSVPTAEVAVLIQSVYTALQSVGEIYKIHGSASDPRSLSVLKDFR